MATSKFEPIHVVAIPFLGRGHINPMISFCTSLALKINIFDTLVFTEEWLGLIMSNHHLPDSPNIRLRTIPNVIPSERTRASNLTDFYNAVYTKMEAPFDQLELPVSCTIADFYLKWMIAIWSSRNIPVVSFWTQALSVFSVYYHFHLLATRGHFPDENLTGWYDTYWLIPTASVLTTMRIPFLDKRKKRKRKREAEMIGDRTNK